MHLGRKSPNYTNTMMGTKLAINMQGGDLGSTRDNSLKTSLQSPSIIRKKKKKKEKEKKCKELLRKEPNPKQECY